MMNLILKRHDGDGWIVFQELGNGTGGKNKGWADAAALGLWPSHGYEMHGYEFKNSREDVKRDLRDPTKSDNVGRYCHCWWLVISDEKIINGLVIPDAWGILTPQKRGGSTVARVVRKAPKVKKPRPFDPTFVAAMIRNVTKTWKRPTRFAALEKEIYDLRHAPTDGTFETARVADVTRIQLERRVKDLEAVIEKFQEESGVDLSGHNRWNAGEIGKAVKTVMSIRGLDDNVLRNDVVRLVRTAGEYHELAVGAAKAAGGLRTMLRDPSVHSPMCLRQYGVRQRCGCGSEVSDAELMLLGDDIRDPVTEEVPELATE